MIERYLGDELLPLAVVALAGMFAFLFLPARFRFRIALVVLPIWLTLGMLPNLGAIQAYAKGTEVVAFAFVGASALLAPGRSRKLGWARWLLVVAVAWFAFVATTADRDLALALRTQWLALVLAALAVVRRWTSDATRIQSLRDFAVGCLLASAIPFFDLLTNPSAVIAGFGRFFPMGANPNHIGLLFAIGGPLGLFYAQRSTAFWRPWWLAGGAGSFGMAVLTGSRAAVACSALIALPSALTALRRPVLALMLSTALVGGIAVVWATASDTATTVHLESGDVERTDVWAYYISKPIAERPFTGLLGTHGESTLADADLGIHPHNAYLELLYLGGVLLAIPAILLLMFALTSAWRRARSKVSPMGWTVFAILTAIAGQGMANGAMYYPTYPWAFLNAVLTGAALMPEDEPGTERRLAVTGMPIPRAVDLVPSRTRSGDDPRA